MNQKNNSKITNAWAFYDWANSVYSLVITSTIFPIYYSIITTIGMKKVFVIETGKWIDEPIRQTLQIFGKNYHPDSVYSSSLTISFLVVVFISPILSSLADTIGNKKSFLQFFCYLGASSCMGLALFTDMDTVFLGLGFSILASIGFWGSLVFYNSFLPDIATQDKQDELSAKGYVFGYIGSVILVIICLFLIQKVAETPKEALIYTRVTFLLTGAWWFGFSQYTFKHLPQHAFKLTKLPNNIIQTSFRELVLVGRKLFKTPDLKFFLSSFFFYSVGMQTIFLMATLFGKSEINLAQDKLILTLLLIQIEAIVGAVIFSKLSKKLGNKNVISIGIILWMIACLSAYFLNKENPYVEYQFYAVAGIVGLVMGGLQAMSRSTYSKLLPEDSQDNAIYFSFYDVLEKLAIILGTFIFAVLIEKYNNMRYACLSMSLFFAIGLIFIRLVQLKISPNPTKLK